MSETLLIVLTVAEIVALVAVLAAFLLVVARRLRSVSGTLAKVGFGVRAVERQLSGIRSGMAEINYELEQLAELLPRVAEQAERTRRPGGATRPGP